MPLYILLGDDDEAIARACFELAGPGGVQSFDLSEPNGGDLLAESAATYPLFGPTRTLVARPAELLSEEHARSVTHLSAAVTVILVGRPTAAALAALGPDVKSREFSLPDGRQLRSWLNEVAQGCGVTLSSSAMDFLTRRPDVDPRRVRHVLRIHAARGRTHLEAEDIRPLLGVAQAAVRPWDLHAALCRGDRAQVALLAQDLEPLPTLAFLAGKLRQCGDPRRQPAAALWALIAAADREAKTGPWDPAAVLEVAAVRAARLWPGLARS